MTIASLLRDAFDRSPRGTQSRLAEAVGVSPQTVNKWASGANDPDPERWPEIEEALGLESGAIERAAMVGAALRLDKVTRRDVDEILERIESIHVSLRRLEDALANRRPPSED